MVAAQKQVLVICAVFDRSSVGGLLSPINVMKNNFNFTLLFYEARGTFEQGKYNKHFDVISEAAQVKRLVLCANNVIRKVYLNIEALWLKLAQL